MTEQSDAAIRHEGVVSPFNALGSDDLVVEARGTRLAVVAGGDPLTTPLFEAELGPTSPRIGGKEASLAEAVHAAAELLGKARFPLIGGLETDTNGMRAALKVAERVGGVVDHAASGPLLATIRVMQTGGNVMATLAEVRNRADLVLFVGTDAASLMPRFFKQVIWPEQRLPGTGTTRRLVFLGDGLDPKVGVAPDGTLPTHLPCATDRLVEAAAVLRALVERRAVRGETPAGLPLSDLEKLAADIREARYAIIVWAASQLPAEDAELTISSLCEMLKTLNQAPSPSPESSDGQAGPGGRALGLALTGPGNSIGANQVTAWSWGVPIRTSVATGAPVYDPDGYATEALLASGRADALLWIASFMDRPPPKGVPTIVLGRAGATAEADIVIPVGTPGLDHAGTVFRTDTVVALPVGQLRESGLPSVEQVLNDILTALGKKPVAEDKA
ncbi:formylmethanofuran dehydrogenase, subunit B [Arboricoccus pini]|uniref:Formylmethanofuran dehydrogenase, subunit B n=1 Tax=Arboricoccus pini TaxID=1963835 RepID=A0A212S021_9PROT|nr:formylmethanofuran dehydrogenase subunit B [Arboricoccus pini]SNB78413.1 formylmethanofuran dehydrogenase, subunit B [Arboricoccus pini]